MKLKIGMVVIAALGLAGCMGTSTETFEGEPHIDNNPVPLAAGAGSDPFPAFNAAVNSYRGPGRNPLAYNTQLQGAAQTHANNMSTNNFFSHTGSDGLSVGDRVSNQGYSWNWVGENIARGQTSTAQALTAWQNSPGHNAILLHSTPTEFGLAHAAGNYWVMVLANPTP